MINANELRIGNWIYQEGYVQLDEKFLTVFFGSFSYKELFPIPITTELLEKSGFNTIKNIPGKNESFSQQFGGHVTFVLTKQAAQADGLSRFFVEVELNVGKGYNMIDINPPQYVHQLQNLVFALTGEEMEIKSLNID